MKKSGSRTWSFPPSPRCHLYTANQPATGEICALERNFPEGNKNDLKLPPQAVPGPNKAPSRWTLCSFLAQFPAGTVTDVDQAANGADHAQTWQLPQPCGQYLRMQPWLFWGSKSKQNTPVPPRLMLTSHESWDQPEVPSFWACCKIEYFAGTFRALNLLDEGSQLEGNSNAPKRLWTWHFVPLQFA